MKWSPLLAAPLFAVALLLLADSTLAQEPAAPAEEPRTEQAENSPPAETEQPESDTPEADKPEDPAPEKAEETEPESKPADEMSEEPKPEAEKSDEAKPEEKPDEKTEEPEGGDKPAEPEMKDQPKEEAKPEEESEEKGDKQEEEKQEDKDAEKPAGQKEEGDKSEGDKKADEKEPKFKPVEWDENVEKVLTQKYPKNTADLKVIQKQTQRVIDHVRPAVVSVRVGQAFGSGIIINSEGLVLTAGHVVGKPGQPVVFIFEDGSTARGKTLGMFREIDSGMMQITDPGPWPHVKMAKENNLKTGEWVVVMSHPGGFDPERTPPVRLGRVLFANEQVISTDCTLVGGDSGGALFNMHGEVVGINSRIGRRITDNFHVPIGTYHETWERLLAGESWGAPLGGSEEQAEARPLLGAAGNPNEPECKLSQIFPGMPADRAGLKVGDIVRTFNGEDIETFDDLARRVYSQKPGDTVKLQIARGEETVDVELRLGVATTPLPGSADLPKDLGSKKRGQKS